jgi:hypothetical protein
MQVLMAIPSGSFRTLAFRTDETDGLRNELGVDGKRVQTGMMKRIRLVARMTGKEAVHGRCRLAIGVRAGAQTAGLS